jgi:hypothetical protein
VGGPSHFRLLVAQMRPRPPAEAYLRLRTLPGEQAQVDWGHFGHLQIGRARRALMAFVMVLSHSRMVFLRFFLDARMDSFLRGHALAFVAFGGVPRVLLYDNLKSAVLERVGDAIRFNPALLALAGHYRFEPRPVAPARGNREGPRGTRHPLHPRQLLRRAHVHRLDDLNAQAALWCTGQAAERRWVEDGAFTVRQAFEAERPKLLALPRHEFALGQRVAVTVAKTPYIRFDLNDYSVPHTHVRRTLAVLADEHTVRILDGTVELARHDRCWDRGQCIEIAAHVQRLVEHKRAARAHRGLDRLAQAAPAASTLLERAAARGDNLGSITAALLRLLERWGSRGAAGGHPRGAAARRAAPQRRAAGPGARPPGQRPAAAGGAGAARARGAARRAGAPACPGLVRPPA